MKIDKCPYCSNSLEQGKLYYINNLRTPKLILENKQQVKIQNYGWSNHIKDVYYCNHCNIYIGKTFEIGK
ncbi:PF20097 family protein [Acholeplasma laidlawii]|jgi:hypothetical protein|uniref:PF20097 family protein n=1 Tax=Acholeplasma laidlawii TaxID=2148 RepID=UPI003F932ACC